MYIMEKHKKSSKIGQEHEGNVERQTDAHFMVKDTHISPLIYINLIYTTYKL